MSELTENSIKTAKPRGKPFPKGVSGNPGGRPPIPAEIKEFAQSKSLQALQIVDKIMNDKDESSKVRLAAADIILDRGLGKPGQSIDMDVKGETKVTMVEVIKSKRE